MTTEEAFIREIRDHPEEDSTWSVYADWLEDLGDPLGELIRVRIQLEDLAATDPERRKLEERQSELEHATSFVEWKSQLSRHGFDVRCRRGFVEELRLELPSWPLSDSSLVQRRLESVQSLLSPPSRFLALLRKLRIRGDLDYGSEKKFRVTPDVAGGLLALGCFEDLESLEIDSDDGTLILGADTVRVVVTHPNLGRLKKLILNGHQVGDEGSQALAASGRWARLTWLELRGNGIGDGGARALATSAHLTKLTDLDLRYNSIGDEGARAFATSAYLGNLRRLKLHGNPVGPEGAAALKRRFGEVCLLPQLQRPGNSRPGDWYCVECGASNFARREVCYECRSERPQPLLRPGDWLCPSCRAHNFARRQSCHQCKTERSS
jgi:uncharacterized protein (TIGR02996 family)